MYNWIVEPLKGVNGIKFGMNRTEVRQIIGKECREFKKSRFSKSTTDDFGFCHVFYNGKDECEAIEIFEDINVTLDGVKIFPTEISILKSIVADFEEEVGSYISKSKSIGIYAPYGKMESILFGNKGYYL